MITASNSFKEKIANGEIPKYRIRLLTAAGVSSWIENDKLWADGISFSDGVSSSGSFDIGSAIIGSFNFILNNFDGTFDDTDFKGAIVYPYAYFEEDGVMDSIPKGTFYVATHKTTGYIIRCTALDGLKLLDQSDTDIQYPVTVESLIRYIAQENNITVADNSIPNGSFVIQSQPEDEMTDRQKLSYACQITGNYAMMNSEGKLHVGWYDFQNPITISTTFDGKDLWTNPITITGLAVTFTLPDDVDLEDVLDGTSYEVGVNVRVNEKEVTILYGTDDNVLYIDNNPYVDYTNVISIVDMVGLRVTGHIIRPGSLPILSDPCIEAGDVLQITDRVTSDVYLFPVTNYNYNRALTQKVTCDFTDKEYDDLRPSSAYDVKKIIEQTVDQYYTWIAYADDAQGTGISLSPTGKAYMGIATNRLTETPVITDPTVYKWSKTVGVGIYDSVPYYLASSQATGVTIYDEGWSKTAPTLTQEKKYLWVYYVTRYGEGETPPQLITLTDDVVVFNYSGDTSPLDACVAKIEAVQSGEGDPSPENIRPITGWTGCNVVVSPTQDAQDGTTYSVSWESEAGTVYGGTVDIVSGVLTVDKAITTVNDLSWSWNNTRSIFYAAVEEPGKEKDNIIGTPIMCDSLPYKGVADSVVHAVQAIGESGVASSVNTTHPYIYLRHGDLNSQASLKAALGTAQIVYQLATPQTYQLTPMQVLVLAGENHIWSSIDETTVSYYDSQKVGDPYVVGTDGRDGVTYYGTCATAAGTAEKEVVCPEITELYAGLTITVNFANASTVGTPTIKINALDAKNIFVAGANATSSNLFLWGAGASVQFVYNGSVFVPVGHPCSYYGTCGTAATTAAKTSTIAQAVICKGTTVSLQMTNATSVANPTLNVSSTGGKAIYANGSRPTADSPYNWEESATVAFAFDGKYWRMQDTAPITKAENALTTANGKNKVYYQGIQPTGGTYVAGDTWFDTAHGNLIYEYNGTNWTTSHTFGTEAIADLAITNAKIANLDAGKIQTGELTTILIRSNNNDYWNLGANDITKTEGGVTYTFKGNTLQTHHLVAEDDIYVDGGPGSYLNIAMQSDTRTANFEVSNTGIKINDVVAWSAQTTKTKYVSFPVRESTVLNASYITEKEDGTATRSDIGLYTEHINLNVSHRNVSGGTFYDDYTLFVGAAQLAGSGPAGSYYHFDFNAVDSKICLGYCRTDPSYVPDPLKTRIFMNDNEITPISEAYPIASGHHGAPAVRVESGMATYMSIGVNATSKTLYVYGSDNKGSLNYIGRVALV